MSSLVDSDREMVRGLQERAARALPAEHIENLDGWLLRHAPGCVWWVGTVLPHGDTALGEGVPGELLQNELLRRVAGAEEFYARHGSPAMFQISPPACPDALDTVLAERGYRFQSVISLQVAATALVVEQVREQATERASTASLRVGLDDRPTRAWFEIWHAVHIDRGPRSGGNPDAEWDMLGRVEQPCEYASVIIGDEVVAVGRAVADTGWAGVFAMATLPKFRGKGSATKVLAALAEWAAANKADRMYLQVEPDNDPAMGLYKRTGFSELCSYHYRGAD